MEQQNISPKSRLIALMLCFFLGWLGAHRFYVGKIGTGCLMILLSPASVFAFGIPIGLWVLIDLIFIACGSFRDKQGRRIVDWIEK